MMAEAEMQSSSEIIKPTFLYHGSSNTEIEEFEPRPEKLVKEFTGLAVFATPDKALASAFTIRDGDYLVNISRYNKGPWSVIISDRDRFEAQDRGSAVYVLPSATFRQLRSDSMDDTEWISEAPVKPETKEVFSTAVEAMTACGVRVYFVDRETWKAIKSAEDHGAKMVSELTSVG